MWNVFRVSKPADKMQPYRQRTSVEGRGSRVEGGGWSRVELRARRLGRDEDRGSGVSREEKGSGDRRPVEVPVGGEAKVTKGFWAASAKCCQQKVVRVVRFLTG